MYCCPVSGFAQAAAPLSVRTGQSQLSELEMNVIKLDLFQELKEWLMLSLILALPRLGYWYTLHTDEFDY